MKNWRAQRIVVEGRATMATLAVVSVRERVNRMDYFWLIPAGIVGLLILWIFYSAISKNAAPSRGEGRVLVDKPPEPPSDPGPLGPERLGLKRTDEAE